MMHGWYQNKIELKLSIHFKEAFSDRGGEILKGGIGFYFSEDVLFYLCVVKC